LVPQAYVSVNYDHNRSTVTAAVPTIPKLQRELRSAGIIAAEFGLFGRYHSAEHRAALPALFEFCDAHQQFQFPDASQLAMPTRSNSDGDTIKQGRLDHHALRSILVERPEWFKSFGRVQSEILQQNKDALVVSLGSERCVPPSLTNELRDTSQLVHLADLHVGPTTLQRPMAPHNDRRHGHYADTDIAVVGMACKVANADNLEEFWDVLSSGQSQHREVPQERFSFETAFRDVDPKRKWFGNFIKGHDMFDHKFFKTSPRESATTDPQQRQLLQVAYQAVEQSGYFHVNHNEQQPDRRHVGCYIGLCGTDYENNIACESPNAFSATGNLEGFAAGKISHYFGWTGPALVVDTACSSSAVAIHQACRAIISGECSAALAGGTHVMTSPLRFQNLAGASFLSLTGQCKPFDAKADGYCRGEGIAAVFLKKASAAVADGDQILGVIAATGVQQNQNCTPIFVPNAPSLSDLFRRVTVQARLKPDQISVVEAHGTGTAVGDPAEYESVRRVLGGRDRREPLVLGSLKGFIGHTEPTSGVLSLIKVLLMMRKAAIPAQASFDTINPAINVSPADNIIIPKSNRPWDAEFRAALVNNYGASGSNASMVITQGPNASSSSKAARVAEGAAPTATNLNLKYPFWFCGNDTPSLRRYASALRQFLRRETHFAEDLSLANISFNAARQSNRRLNHSLVFSVRSVDELEQKLAALENGAADVASAAPGATPPSKPVILCFGGQVSGHVGLDRDVYARVAVLRKHLDDVDAVARSLGVGSIFPGIFQRQKVQDVVQLQVMLFAMQYACARSWIDSGVQPAAIVGHSFGEITGLCISGILSLQDTLKVIIGRATAVRENWGVDKGAMMAVEGDLSDVEELLAEASRLCSADATIKGPSVACYNGPRSFTLAGSTAAIDAVAKVLGQRGSSALRAKRLDVTNAFHCALVDPFMEQLEQGGQGVVFREPKIPLERATERECDLSREKLTARFVADHMRRPVFFNHAVQRLVQRYPACIFLEAGSSSTIASMAGRALGNPAGSVFQGVNITGDLAPGAGWNNLADATLNLWMSGLRVDFWAHQSRQTREYTPLLLPPYQFEQSRHWIELKKPAKATAKQEDAPVREAEKPVEQLLSFGGYQDARKRVARFRINTETAKYKSLVSGHLFAETAPICPATVQLDFVIEALRSLRPDLVAAKLEPQLHGVQCQLPVCVDPTRSLWIEFSEDDEASAKGVTWRFQVFSADRSASSSVHTTGTVVLRSVDDAAAALEFAHFERLMRHQRCKELLQSGDADEMLRGRNMYKIFTEIVDYEEDYRGVEKLVGHGSESAGYVVRKVDAESWLNAHLADCFCQVAGIWANCMTDRAPADMFVCNGMERWLRNPALRSGARPDSFHVLATHTSPSPKAVISDVFAFDAQTGTLVEVVLGVSYVKIPKASMSKLLTRLSGGVTPAGLDSPSGTAIANIKAEQHAVAPALAQTTFDAPNVSLPKVSETPRPAASASPDVADRVKAILCELSGAELDEIREDSSLADLGVDSLLGMELAHDLESAFQITLHDSDLLEITDLPGLIKCVQAALGGSSSVSSDVTPSATDSEAETAPSEVDAGVDVDVACGGSEDGLELPFATVAEAFNETKCLTDDRIVEYGQAAYANVVDPLQTQLCIALIIEAFEELGCPLRTAAAGQQLARIGHPAELSRLVDALYRLLEKEAKLIHMESGRITRTAVPAPSRSSRELLQDLTTRFPDQAMADRLTFHAGSHLADVLRGKTDGIKLIFGSSEGREMAAHFYAEWPLHRLLYRQLEDFLGRLVAKLRSSSKGEDGPLRILEMGAGTGGTTRWLLPLLAKAGMPVEYTFSDLAPSFVVAARKRWSKQYPFMKFCSHDIEKEPAKDLQAAHHIVIASNAVHATHNLRESAQNIRKALRSDGLLVMVEMTSRVNWMDLVFGLFEGWWFFEDGREYVVSDERQWEKELQAVGYGFVDWTDGSRPENKMEKLIIAMASSDTAASRCANPPPIPSSSAPLFEKESASADSAPRQAVVDRYVHELTEGFGAAFENAVRARANKVHVPATSGKVVVVTGATGSLGSHLVVNLAARPDVRRIVCLNRRSKQDPKERQRQALLNKGLSLPPGAAEKLVVFETDLSKPRLGLPVDDYHTLADSTTHIVHNAWTMNTKWPLRHFEPQLRIMRNMIDLARDAASRFPSSSSDKVTFQFVSSIAAVGHWPLHSGQPLVPEERMSLDSVLPLGYGDAKHICERMLDETLHRFPQRFRGSVARPGQIAACSTSGYWNALEHVAFLIKSSQTLGALPDLPGHLAWAPVDVVAGTLADLLLTLPDDVVPYPVYHVDNPVRQPWAGMVRMLARALGIPEGNIVPFEEWLRRVRTHNPAPQQQQQQEADNTARRLEGGDNPALLLADFFERDFIHMSCGDLVLGTARACEHSVTLAGAKPFDEDLVRLFVKHWKETGFLA
jgi:acyl transferase domain-containing protein/thioester reductase-like protein/acyl carrier protein/SAM-dependent methyltransferase